MSKRNPRRGSFGTIGTAVLGSLCLGGAVAYGLTVGGSLVSQPGEVPTPQVSTVRDLETLPPAPEGQLQVQVNDENRAYLQNITCKGDAEEDPQVCATLSRIAQEQAEESGAANPFAEVAKGAECDSTNYGTQEAYITGEWEGQKVDTKLSRSNSCEEARWQRLRPVTKPLL